MRNTTDVTGGKPIAVLLQPISGVSAINPLVAFYDIHGRKRCYSFILSRTPQETYTRHTIKLIINLNPFLPIRHRNFNPKCLSVPIMSTLRVVIYNIWPQIEDRYVN
jgi:hypothetical protein